MLNDSVSESTAIIAASMNSLLPGLPNSRIVLRSLVGALLLHDDEDGRLLRVVSVWQWLGIGGLNLEMTVIIIHVEDSLLRDYQVDV